MEEDLKISKVEYLINQWLNLTQISKVSFKVTKPKLKIAYNENLKILKVEYLSNHWSYLPQIFNLRWGDQAKNEIWF